MVGDRSVFFGELAEIMEEDVSLLLPDSKFRDFASWDSLAVISYVALLDEKYGVLLETEMLEKAITFNDLAKLANI